MAEAGNLKFGMQLGFVKAHHKTTPRGKVGVSAQIFGVRFNISLTVALSS